MPVLIFGDMKNGWSRSLGFSSSQTLSSFCQTLNRPSVRLASLMISANGRKPPGAGAAALGADTPLAAALAPRGADAPAALACAAPAWARSETATGAPEVAGAKVAQPASSPSSNGDASS